MSSRKATHPRPSRSPSFAQAKLGLYNMRILHRAGGQLLQFMDNFSIIQEKYI